MLYSRRDLGKIAITAGAACTLMAARPNSIFGGVQIGNHHLQLSRPSHESPRRF